MSGPRQDPEAAKYMKAELEKDNRDVSDLWSEALRAYKGIVGTDLQPKFANVNDMIAFGTREMNSFHSFRHNQKKVDKLRGLFMKNLDYIEKGAQQLVAAATPAFPPAAAIGTALTYMLSACKSVSADYDVVNAFFEDMNAFLQRITILESRLPKYPAYRNCLMDVFTSILKMCGFATKYIELGRMKKWVINLIKGEDSELGGARKSMDVSLSRLQSATEYAILGNTEENNRMTVELQQNQNMHTEMIENQTKMLEDVLEHQNEVKNDLKNIQKLLTMFDQQNRDSAASKATKAASKNKPATSTRIRTYFEDTVDPVTLYHGIKERMLPDTCKWLFAQDEWLAFMALELSKNEGLPILAIEGTHGHGKSHLAVSVYDQLIKSASPDTCVSHFYFSDQGSNDLSMFCNAINWIVIQIAEQSPALCERLNAEVRRDDLAVDRNDWQDVWTNFVVPLFPAGSAEKLYIVWDGLNELPFKEMYELHAFLKNASTMGSTNIALVCTTRPWRSIDEGLRGANAKYLEVTSEKQKADLQVLIWHHLNNDDRLKRFSKYAKQSIVNSLTERPGNQPPYYLLYAEHILRHFDTIGREPLVLKQLKSLPADWAALYKIILDDTFTHTGPNEMPAMRLLFNWLAHSNRALTLQECLALLKMHKLDAYDLERELQGNSLSRFLRLAPAEERNAAGISVEQPTLDVLAAEQTVEEEAVSDGDHPLRFHDRSTSRFFAAAPPNEVGLRTPKTPGNREIFLLCAEMLCGGMSDVEKSLKQYAAAEWVYHWSWCSITKESPEEEKIPVMESLAAIMTNRNNVAAQFVELDVDCDNQLFAFEGDTFSEVLKLFSDAAVEVGSKLSAEALAFYQKVSADVQTSLVPLARAHVQNWLQAESVAVMHRCYIFARQCLDRSNLKTLLLDDDGDSNVETRRFDVDEVVNVFNAFEDIPKDGRAYLSFAAFLKSNLDISEALEYAQKASELLPAGSKSFLEAQLIAADAHIWLSEFDEAAVAINLTLNQSDAPAVLRRRAFVALAKLHKEQDQLDEAAKCYEQARQADPQEPMSGDDLYDEFYLYLSQRDDAKTVDRIASWKTTEKLTIMTWNYDGSGHNEFMAAAGRSGKMDVAIQVYEEVIKLLNTVDAGAPIRYELAQGLWLMNGDAERAKALLNETLDSISDGYVLKFTNEDPSQTFVAALFLMSDIIYEQFRTSSDRAEKAKLFAEINDLPNRPFAQTATASKSDVNHHRIVVSKMARKMATAEGFQDTLQSAFDACYEALIDNVGWNDWLNMMNMTSILMQLDGLEREAQILASAQFSKLDAYRDFDAREKAEAELAEAEAEAKAALENDPGLAGKGGEDDAESGEDDGDGNDDDDESDGDEDGDDESLPPTDEGELNSDISAACDGECNPNVVWQYWKDTTMYVCVLCRATNLCEECYEKRQGYNADPTTCPVKGPYFCGHEHEYVQAPVEGWRGVTNGIMSIEGEEDVEFKVWLEELKNDKWVKAWERYWLKES